MRENYHDLTVADKNKVEKVLEVDFFGRQTNHFVREVNHESESHNELHGWFNGELQNRAIH